MGRGVWRHGDRRSQPRILGGSMAARAEQGMALPSVGVHWAPLQSVTLLPESHISYIWVQAFRNVGFFLFLFVYSQADTREKG